MRMRTLVLLVVGVLTMAMIGCLAYVPPPPPDAVYAPGPPPAPVVETVPVIPFPGAVWIGGYWGWGPAGYYWNRGYYGRPPHPGGTWVPGGWHHHSRGYYYHPGRWR